MSVHAGVFAPLLILVATMSSAQDPLSPTGNNNGAFVLEAREHAIEDLVDTAYAMPNVNINVAPATGSTVTISIRGQGGSGFVSTESPSTSIYIDDVLVTRSPGLLIDMLDMDRIEVLKGPQGTLFGQNTTAGTFRMMSKLPDGTFNGWATFGAGSLSRQEAKGAVGFPILGETLSGRVAWLFRQRDGFTRNRPQNTNPAVLVVYIRVMSEVGHCYNGVASSR